MPYARQTWVDGSTDTPLNAARLSHMEDGIGAAARVMQSTAIDPTGVTDCTAGVQAFLDASSDGDIITVPSGTYTFSSTITISKRIVLTGAGVLSWTSGIAGSAAIAVNADGTPLSGLRMTSTVTPNATGNKQYGIYVSANYCAIADCYTTGLQQAIAVSPYGEYHDTVIAYNRVLQVPGSAAEDRGDGIVNWGAASTIVGNRVSAAIGTDARIGIHCEGLSTLENTAYAHADQQAAIAGNTVTGKFRRSIVSEGVAHVAITGNSVADATWWAIAVIGAAGAAAITGNTVNWTRTSSDTQGSSYNPDRCAFMVYGQNGGPNGVIIADNTVNVVTGAVMTYGVRVKADTSVPVDLQIHGNTFSAADHNMTTVVYCGSASLGIVSDNICDGFTNTGIYFTNSGGAVARNNHLFGNNASYGVRMEGDSHSGHADGNYMESCTTGVSLYQRNSHVSANMNTINNVTTGIDLNGSSGAVSCSMNLFTSVTTKTANLPTGTVSVGNN